MTHMDNPLRLLHPQVVDDRGLGGRFAVARPESYGSPESYRWFEGGSETVGDFLGRPENQSGRWVVLDGAEPHLFEWDLPRKAWVDCGRRFVAAEAIREAAK